MSSLANLPLLRKEMISKRYLLQIYITISIIIISFVNLTFFLNNQKNIPSIIVLGILLLTFIIYFISGRFIYNPKFLSLNILKVLFIIVIISWVYAISFDIYYRNALDYTVFLDAVLAVIGIFLVYQILLKCQSMIKQPLYS